MILMMAIQDHTRITPNGMATVVGAGFGVNELLDAIGLIETAPSFDVIPWTIMVAYLLKAGVYFYLGWAAHNPTVTWPLANPTTSNPPAP